MIAERNTDVARDRQRKATKKVWESNVDFREKMKKRKTRGSDGSRMKELWADPTWRKKMLESRKKNETNKSGRRLGGDYYFRLLLGAERSLPAST